MSAEQASFPVVHHAKHDLAATVVAQAALERLAGISEGKNFVDGLPEIPAIDQPGKLHQLVAAWPDDEVDGIDTAFGRELLRRFLGDGYESATRTQQ